MKIQQTTVHNQNIARALETAMYMTALEWEENLHPVEILDLRGQIVSDRLNRFMMDVVMYLPEVQEWFHKDFDEYAPVHWTDGNHMERLGKKNRDKIDWANEALHMEQRAYGNW